MDGKSTGTTMSIERVFFVYAAVLGVIVGAIILLVPESRALSIGPYFWVLGGIALFEAIAVYLRGGLTSGPPMSMTSRLIGFFIAVVPMLFVRLTAGV